MNLFGRYMCEKENIANICERKNDGSKFKMNVEKY